MLKEVTNEQDYLLNEYAIIYRTSLQATETQVRGYITKLKSNNSEGEAIAQATLALRHIEDARMRLGKVLQYLDDGVSIYDK